MINLRNKNMNQRFWEIDALRGIAIVMMIIFHFFLDLSLSGRYSIDIHSVFWRDFAITVATTFIFIVGASLTISYSRLKQKSFIAYLKRGLKIFSWGLLITILTWLFLRERFIIFGILHFIGIAIILAYPFVKFINPVLNIIFGVVIIFLGTIVSILRFNFPYLLWLGFIPSNFHSLDYFPILPWFGIILIGISFGKIFYLDGKRIINIPDLSKFKAVKVFSFLGRHSLFIYLIHQPIMIALLYIFLL